MAQRDGAYGADVVANMGTHLKKRGHNPKRGDATQKEGTQPKKKGRNPKSGSAERQRWKLLQTAARVCFPTDFAGRQKV